jgi:polyhydroxybutyrate depolymerase
MATMKLITLLVLLTACQPLRSEAAQRAAAATQSTPVAATISVDGLTRSFISYIPARLPDGPVPLVFMLHGGGGSAESVMTNTTEGRWNELADRDGFIVVYPDALDNIWNDCRVGNNTPQADDVAFIEALIEHHAQRHLIDRQRIYAAGHSNGGMMAMRLAIELPLAAIYANTSALPVDSECAAPPRPVSVMFLAGTADPIVPFGGGVVNLPSGSTGSLVLSAEATVAVWVRALGATSAPYVTQLPNLVVGDGSTLTLTVYTGVDGSEMRYYRADGGGHGWPAPTQFPPAQQLINGRKNQDIVGADEGWAFFQRHTLQSDAPSHSFFAPMLLS